MRHLRGWKIGILITILTCIWAADAHAQINYLSFASRSRQLYFGIALGINISDYKVTRHEEFLYNDTILGVTPSLGPGFTLGIVSNLNLGKYFDLRFVPSLTFAEKKLNYSFRQDSIVGKTIESIYLDFPLSIRFKSEPIGDIRLYVLAGMKYDLDLASNADARKAEDQVKVVRHDVAFEYGFGLQIFFPLFIFSPEIKVSHGLLNLHSRDENLIYSNVVDKLFSRTFLISFYFEG